MKFATRIAKLEADGVEPVTAYLWVNSRGDVEAWKIRRGAEIRAARQLPDDYRVDVIAIGWQE